jgi:succinate dehydrogenase/fumarate reductase flavoprotein subunit
MGTTGDGHKLAFRLGAQGVDMANVQIHPTGFVDPKDPTASTKTLAAEILRGAGGLLLTRDGRRFVDELGTRDYVSGRMLAEAKAEANAGGLPDGEGVSFDFILLLNDAGAREADKHVPLYTQKGLLREFDSIEDLAKWLDDEVGAKDVRGSVGKGESIDTAATVRTTLAGYDETAGLGGPDPATNKTFFHNAPFSGSNKFYAGRVTPVVHYTMGGVRVDHLGRVVAESGDVIEGLYAAGELIGGVHGRNRLGGNALTECAVFGRIVGGDVPIASPSSFDDAGGGGGAPAAAAPARVARRDVTKAELGGHASEASCWVAVYGEVYDFTDFLDEHPAGAEAILKYGGTDGTAIFDSVHSKDMLDDFDAIGPLVD